MPRDVIVILGCAVRPGGLPSPAMRRRVQAALLTARGSSDARFVPVGGVGRHGPAEARVMAELLLAAGVEPSRICEVPRGGNTIASLREALVAIAPPPGGRLYVCTDRYHRPRCRAILRLWGLRSVPGADPPTEPPRAGRHWARDACALVKDAPLACLWRVGGRLPRPADERSRFSTSDAG